MEYVISVEEVEVLNETSLNDLEVELYFQVFMESKTN